MEWRRGIERRDPRPVHVDDGAEAAGRAADHEWCVPGLAQCMRVYVCV